MDLGLNSQVALVTASSKGLGKATAFELAKEGAKVMISSRNQEDLEKTANEIKEQTGAEVAFCVADLTKSEDIDNLIQETANRFGTIHILVNNAGGPPPGNFDQFQDQDWQYAFELNLLSVIRLIRGVLPFMRQQQYGRIVNFTSSSIKEPIQGLILSNTFRTAVVGLTKSLSVELAGDQILINTVAPGRIATDRLASLDQTKAKQLGISVEEVQQQFFAQIPLGRYGEPSEFAKVATFLASKANSYITGQALLVDGGMVKAI
ncbi:SDR family oxidoreductase [Thermoflavimicrobium dichotomicum]|uniref:3-oxoacyl-[acyl-carrier protein] reductase n=1 Tax=Thermoflavimicrobium dichotomicum TaxID=46223 RepID=A0A1I3NXL8_9BACL|nr:SDR family oxidoreductase [Thermoflavimicrobium dichotomicum]SFJ13770.1 3-oxoacyl-[acyl-carrier protein] reductase [Thermoflavimicrobium dichotomicum]